MIWTKMHRKYFIDKILKTKPTSGKFDMNKLLTYTAGLTGAQLELVSKEASFYCIRHNLPTHHARNFSTNR